MKTDIVQVRNYGNVAIFSNWIIDVCWTKVEYNEFIYKYLVDSIRDFQRDWYTTLQALLNTFEQFDINIK